MPGGSMADQGCHGKLTCNRAVTGCHRLSQAVTAVTRAVTAVTGCHSCHRLSPTAHTVLNWTPRCGSRPYTVVLGTAGHESIRYSVVLGVGHIKIPRCSVLARAEYQHHSTRCVPQNLTVSA